MTQSIEAVYIDGVLKPDRDLGLRERQRVRLIVETIDKAPADRAAALDRLRAGIARMQFYSKGLLPARAELHDRPPPATPQLSTARRLHLEHDVSFWDALIVAACLDAGVRTLYSEDVPGRPEFGPLTVVNPFV